MKTLKITCVILILFSSTCIINNIRAAVSDSIVVQPVAPSINDSIVLYSYVTVPNCCLPYDSVWIETVSDTIIGVSVFHTEHYPACDCYCQCTDTISLGKLMPGNYRIIVATSFIDTALILPVYVLDEIHITVSSLLASNVENSTWISQAEIYYDPLIKEICCNKIMEETGYRLLRIDGMILAEGRVLHGRIDASYLTGGIYFIKLHKGDQTITRKLLIH